MSRHDKDSVGDRLEREYRYHPDMWMRKYIKYMAYGIIPCVIIVVYLAYYVVTGGAAHDGDSQYILNTLRQADTSPRSELNVYRDPALNEIAAARRRAQARIQQMDGTGASTAIAAEQKASSS